MQKRFQRDYLAILDEREKNADERVKPVTVQSILDEQPLNVLEGLVKRWPCHDIRYEGYGSSDDELLVDMVKGMEQRISRKDLHNGILEYVVEMVRNLDEIERFNRVVKKHNQAWKDRGSPTKVFNPLTGDISREKNGYTDPVMMQSRHYALPDSAYSGKSNLGKHQPNIKRKSHVRVKYQMRITDDNLFVLGYAAYDHDDRILFYNELQHKDLTYLVRRSVQEIWGTPTATKIADPLLEGIQMLINGDKLVICKQHCKFPEFMAHETSQVKSTKAIRKMEVEEIQSVRVSNFTGFYLPILVIIGFVVCLFWTIGILAGESIPLEIMSNVEEYSLMQFPALALEVLIKPQMLGCILLLLLTIFLRKVSQSSDRNASELKARRRFS